MQVHRARLHDGREVAVKVQYPGLQAAVTADLAALASLASAAAVLFPNAFDFGWVISELQVWPHPALLSLLQASHQWPNPYMLDAFHNCAYAGLDAESMIIPAMQELHCGLLPQLMNIEIAYWAIAGPCKAFRTNATSEHQLYRLYKVSKQ